MRPVLVVKVGTSSLLDESDQANIGVFNRIAEDIIELCTRYRVVLVTSGAIGFGVSRLGLDERPSDIGKLQALATIGQVGILRAWRKACAPHPVGQVLVTRHELDQSSTREQFVKTIDTMVDHYNTLPIINENDAIANEEVTYGDNDRLAAEIAVVMEAEALVLLTNQPGIIAGYGTDQPKLLHEVSVTDAGRSIESDKSRHGRGGMLSKVDAAKIACRRAVQVYVSDARVPQPVSRAVRGESGTHLVQ